MNGIRIEIDVEHADRDFTAGDSVTGHFYIANAGDRKLKAAECSVLWYTVGKGDEDLHVHALERHELDHEGQAVSSCTHDFAFVLPASPHSYDGVIVKVRWCVRVRAFLVGGQEVVSETPITLGRTAPARLADPASPSFDPTPSAISG